MTSRLTCPKFLQVQTSFQYSVFIFVLASMPVIICEKLHCTKFSHYTVPLRAKLGALLIIMVCCYSTCAGS